jgi:hypothetical protein
MKRVLKNLLFLSVILSFSLSCQEDILVPNSGAVLEFNDTEFTTDDWTEDTHTNISDPFYDEVFEGYAARIIQHEYDHIDGVLFTDHLKPLRKRLIQRKLKDISTGNIEVNYRMNFPIKK